MSITKTTNFFDHQDRIDSRDLIFRLDDLGYDYAAKMAYDEDCASEHRDEIDEFCQILDFIDNSSEEDVQFGVQLIAEDDFQNYAKELADDLGLTDSDVVQWPYTRIDWKAAAEDLAQDYTLVKIGGKEYWVR